jgi:hypothetical protein
MDVSMKLLKLLPRGGSPTRLRSLSAVLGSERGPGSATLAAMTTSIKIAWSRWRAVRPSDFALGQHLRPAYGVCGLPGGGAMTAYALAQISIRYDCYDCYD